MSRRVSLEEFDGPEQLVAPPQIAAAEPLVDLDALRSGAFEEGYKSGWEDCRAEQHKAEDGISSDLAQSLKSVDLTYRDARRDVLSAIKPLIDAIVSQLLPKLGEAGLGAVVAQELMPMLQSGSELEPELRCAPQIGPVLQNLIEKRQELNIRVAQDTSLGSAQVTLRLGAEARDIDLDAAIEKIGTEFETFTDRLIADLTLQG